MRWVNPAAAEVFLLLQKIGNESLPQAKTPEDARLWHGVIGHLIESTSSAAGYGGFPLWRDYAQPLANAAERGASSEIRWLMHDWAVQAAVLLVSERYSWSTKGPKSPRPKRAAERHQQWTKLAGALRQTNRHLSAKAIAERIADSDGGVGWRAVYAVVLPALRTDKNSIGNLVKTT